MIKAVVFDMDGVLVQSEEVWDEVRERLVREGGGRWRDDAHASMMGMSTQEWTRFMADDLALPMQPEAITAEVVARLKDRYAAGLPVIDGAFDAVRRLHAAGLRLAVASSSTLDLIETVLRLAEVRSLFEVAVSSEEVDRGKPAPDVYLEACRRLDLPPSACAAVEDSSAGLRAARAAGMARVIAVPNPTFPPSGDAVALADVVLASLRDLHL